MLVLLILAIKFSLATAYVRGWLAGMGNPAVVQK